MSLKSLLLPILAVAGGAAAQCSSTATLTIQNAGDAGGLAGCRTYKGSVAIATGTTDPINLSGVQEIQGSLIANNATRLPSLQADSLQTITETFELFDLTILTSLNFPRLAKVGTINWRTVPRLNALTFTNKVKEAMNVGIVDTALSSLTGIELTTVTRMAIIANGGLQSLDMPLEQVTDSLRIESNGRNMNVALPNLEVANNATFRGVRSVSVPSLQGVNGSLGFYNNYFTSLAAPNLTSTGGSLLIVSNEQLTNVSFPALTSLTGSLQVANNTLLSNITGFPRVNTVRGAVDIAGNFTAFDLPQVGQSGAGVFGAFNLQSVSDINAICSRFQPLAGQNEPIKGKFTCTQTNTPTLVDGSSGGGSGASASSTPGVAGDISARSYAVTGALGLVAAILGMF